MFCRYCGKEILDEAVLCPHCGVMVKNVTLPTQQVQNVPKKVKETSKGIFYKAKHKFCFFLDYSIGYRFYFTFIKIGNH